VVCATNKDLREEVRAGRFREDLLYRLNVVTLRVPTLCERKEDIPILAEFFLHRKTKSKNAKTLSPGALRLLMEYHWPGNVRELEHVVEGAILLSSGEVVEENDLAMYFHRPEQPGNNGASGGDVPPASVASSLEEMERLHIDHVLKLNNYNRARTAETLGISKKTLYLKIKRYGLIAPE
jgi:DNA-binding NtrC family response regulator